MGAKEAFGKVLQLERKQQRLTQQVLADRAVVQRGYISRIETGKSCPSVSLVFKICGVLRVRPSAMIARVEELMRGNHQKEVKQRAR